MLAVTTAVRTELYTVADWTRVATMDTEISSEISFAASGPLLASASFNHLTIWRYDQPSILATLQMEWGPLGPPTMTVAETIADGAVAFHPTLPVLAATFPSAVVVYDVDFDALLARADDLTVHYANAKVVMVGESGVGKSALGLVLTGNEFRPTESTHGRYIWTLASDTETTENGMTVHREVLLWDLAGQPGYRVFHRQHLNEVSVALVLYDARSETDPFAGVSYWARALDDATRGFPITKFLIEARTDRGGTAVSERQLGELAARHGFARCFVTSAKRGDGVAELAATIHAAIAWDRLPLVSAFRLFYDMKAFVLAEKLGGRVVQRRGDLRARLDALVDATITPPSFDACIGQLEAAGLVKRLSFSDLVLLQPELLDSYSAWMALAARQEPSGLGFLSERAARAGTFAMDLDRPLRGNPEEELLLAATIEDVVGRGIALRQPTEQGEMLVFPSELRDDMPDGAPDHVRTVVFAFEGPVKSVYAMLAVCLTHAPAFTQQRLYRAAAVFQSASGETCGFCMDYPRQLDDGYGRLTVFFDAATTVTTKLTFLRYVNRQLERMAFRDSVRCERVYYCDCGYPYPVPPDAVAWRKERGERTVICHGCGGHLVLDNLAEQSARLDVVVEKQIEESDAERERQRRLSVMTERERGDEYDVFLCHNSRDRSVVKQLDRRLRDHGILPWLDDNHLLPGTPIVRALEAVLDQIRCAAIVVGPHALGQWQEHEYHALISRLIQRSRTGHQVRIVPVLVPGAVETPPFLRSIASVDFRSTGLEDRNQLKKLIQAILSARTRERGGAS